MSKPDFTPKETYSLRDGMVVSVAAVARWAGYSDRRDWWKTLTPSEKFWYASEYAKRRTKW